MGELSKSFEPIIKRETRIAKAKVKRRPNEEGRSRSCIIAIVDPISCHIVRSGKEHL